LRNTIRGQNMYHQNPYKLQKYSMIFFYKTWK